MLWKCTSWHLLHIFIVILLCVWVSGHSFPLSTMSEDCNGGTEDATATAPSPTAYYEPLCRIDNSGEHECNKFARYPIMRFIGGDGNEISAISKIVESAFETYRKNLVTLVEGIDKILEKMDQLNAKNNFKYASVHSKMKDFALQLPELWEHNENILRKMVNPWELKFDYLILPPATSQSDNNEELMVTATIMKDDSHIASDPNNTSNTSDSTDTDSKKNVAAYNSMVQLLIHLDRDWSSFGKAVRKNLYQEGILPLLERFVPYDRQDESLTLIRPRVLVPGAGLGRLLGEIAALGYDVEGNECSGTMIAMMHTLFNKLLPRKEMFGIYPFLHNQLQDDWNLESRSIKAFFPFIEDSPFLLESLSEDGKGDLGMGPITIQYGDFVGIYGEQHEERKERYDAVVTCFFIDTSQDIIEYINTIFHVLRKGGIWINLGPLHYHSRQAVPYSFNHLLEIIELSGFLVVEDTKVVEAAYCGEDFYSMKPEVYRVPLTAFRKENPTAFETMDSLDNESPHAQCTERVIQVDSAVSPFFHPMNYRIVK